MGATRLKFVLTSLKPPASGSTLNPMQACDSNPSSPTTRSFAGLLADYATPEKKFPPARDLDGLEDDIATLSYEHALRANARYRPPDPPPDLPSPPAVDEAQRELAFVSKSAPARSVQPPLRKASVSVRLSRTEDEQLRQRAAEAGMTVSAYLRSCAFEVETLRAQVKQTLAEMRHPAPPPETAHRPLWSRLRQWKTRQSGSAGA